MKDVVIAMHILIAPDCAILAKSTWHLIAIKSVSHQCGVTV